jgi:hypothetical protein
MQDMNEPRLGTKKDLEESHNIDLSAYKSYLS